MKIVQFLLDYIEYIIGIISSFKSKNYEKNNNVLQYFCGVYAIFW